MCLLLPGPVIHVEAQYASACRRRERVDSLNRWLRLERDRNLEHLHIGTERRVRHRLEPDAPDRLAARLARTKQTLIDAPKRLLHRGQLAFRGSADRL